MHYFFEIGLLAMEMFEVAVRSVKIFRNATIF